ncbi:MAG: transketolase family protein [Bacteroidetes bacterium]|jgi:transketolase|nr:transketolase family protein [Bacteroidota bacterium]
MTTKTTISGIANQQIFANTLVELARNDKDVYAVTSDSRGSGKLEAFGEEMPEQIVEVGIAEQNLVGVAAGLASTGKKVYAVSPSCFLSARAIEQIKNDICYSDNPATMVGISAGVSYGALGSTHHSIHDLAVLRAINNISIVVPADNYETDMVVNATYGAMHPHFIRLGKRPLYDLPRLDNTFEIGKASVIKNGTDLVIFANGETVCFAYEAALELAKEGIDVAIISMHTIKPLDEKAILKWCNKCAAVMTVEEHSLHGGLGEATATLLMKNSIYKPFKLLAIPDEYTITGNQLEILGHYDISKEGIYKHAKTILH